MIDNIKEHIKLVDSNDFEDNNKNPNRAIIFRSNLWDNT